MTIPADPFEGIPNSDDEYARTDLETSVERQHRAADEESDR